MNVTHIFLGLGYGGIETMLVNIANEQQKRGLSVSIVIINDLIVEELLNKISPEVRLVCVGRKVGLKNILNFHNFLISYRLNKILYDLSPDVIHLHASSIFNYLDSCWRGRTCCTLHAMPIGSFGASWNLMSKIQGIAMRDRGNVRCLNSIPFVFSISESVATGLRDNYHVNSIVIPNGIHTNIFEKRNHSLGDVWKIVQVGRLYHKEKGQDLSIEAIKLLKDRGFNNIEFYLIGGGDSLSFLKMLVSTYDLNDNVHFLGPQKQDYIMRHLKDFDLMVQPSRQEGFGLTVAEAMASMLPVLTSSGQGPAEITEGERYGWIFKAGDAQDLANRIVYIFTNYDEAHQKVKAAFEHVADLYDVKMTAGRYVTEYNAICKRNLN